MKEKIIASLILFMMLFQICIQINVFAEVEDLSEETIEEIPKTTDETESSSSTETTREYEIEPTMEWDLSEKQDESITGKWTRDDRVLEITGTGKIKWGNLTEKEKYGKLIEKVIINEGITEIGELGFCENLKEAYIPEGVNSIKYAFTECKNLKTVNIPDSVTSIGSYAFYNCSNLLKLNIPSNLTTIETGSFSGCSSLSNVEIPSSVTTINSAAFLKCASFTNIKIPSKVISIGYRAFSECSNLETIEVEANNESYIVEDNILYNKAKTELIRYAPKRSEETYYKIPDNIKIITAGAFSNCENLTTIEIPNIVITIPRWAFYKCTSLKEVNIPNSVIEIGSSAFSECSSLIDLVIPATVENVAIGATDETTAIHAKADSDAHLYTEVSGIGYFLEGIPTDVGTTYMLEEETEWDISINNDNSLIAKWIGKDKTIEISGTGSIQYEDLQNWWEIQYNPLIEKVIINNGIEEIGYNAFKECINLKNVEISESVKNINNGAFWGCINLENIELPESIENIGLGAFYGCNNLKNVIMSDSVEQIEYHAFKDCSNLTNIKISNNLKDIKVGAFKNCKNLKSIELVGEIGEYAFRGCTDLRSVIIKNADTILEDGTFEKSTILYIKPDRTAHNFAEKWGYSYVTGEFEMTSDIYNKQDTKISKISPNTSVEKFRENIDYDFICKIKDLNGDIIDEYSNIGTGFKVVLETGEEYTLVVLGDTDGNGQIDLKELAKAQKKYLDIEQKSDIDILALDLDSNGSIDLKDLAKLQKVYLGITNL